MASPPADTFEISIFGPGIGECLVLHVGDGEWVVVDSCLVRDTGEPAALAYLKTIGVAPTAIRLVVATHWHDDHIQGLAKILRAAPNAEFATSLALQRPEFHVLVNVAADATLQSSGASEIDRVLRMLLERKESRGARAIPIRWLNQNRLVLAASSTCPWPVRITSLSPSDVSVHMAVREFAALTPNLGQPKRRLPRVTSNQGSAALQIEMGPWSALLGGDLEELGRKGEGWTGVLVSRERPEGRSFFFKVPHHGSPTGHHDDVWRDMLTSTPIAVVTPYNAGVRPLPNSSDLRRLKSLAAHVFVTATKPGRVARRDSAIERAVADILIDRRSLVSGMGQVRVSVADRQQPEVVLSGSAYRAGGTGDP
jgi:beta-lactamase superfamily II metal-dependent hydrolase